MPKPRKPKRPAAKATPIKRKEKPLRFTETKIAEALRKTRGLISPAAEHLQCDRETIYRYLKRFPNLQQVLKEERERTTDIAELALLKAIQDKEGWAVCFYLKCQGRNRGYIERLQVESFNYDPTQCTDEQLRRIASGENPLHVLGSGSGGGGTPDQN